MTTFGESLRREREMRGIELRDIADATKISVRFLQAIEQDRLDVLPGGIFPKAFVRQYARHLGLDADRLVAEFVYSNTAPSAPVAELTPPRSNLQRGWLIVALVLAVAVLGATGWFWRSASVAAPGAPPELREAPAPPVPLQPSDRVYPAPTSDPRRVTSAAMLEVHLTSRRNCWVGAQVDGVKALDRVLGNGESVSLKGSEIVLSVGNAGGIDYTINGQAGIPLGGEGEVRRNVVITRDGFGAFLARPEREPGR